jgi:hypothetical protein
MSLHNRLQVLFWTHSEFNTINHVTQGLYIMYAYISTLRCGSVSVECQRRA